MPEWAQAEGIEPLLDRLQAAHVTDIATSPYVMEPSVDGTREPPADAGSGKVRLLDRDLWGQREIKVRTAPSFIADNSFYQETTYQPPAPDDLTAREGHIVADFIAAAQKRGMKVWFQVQSAIPPGYRVQFGGPTDGDKPRGPDGAFGPTRVDANASLAAPDVLEYGRAMMKDLARAYPQIDGIRLDWPEYPPYHAHALFFDFCDHALAVANSMDIDVERMRQDTSQVQAILSAGLTNDHLRKSEILTPEVLTQILAPYPGALDLLTLRRRLSGDLLASFRAALPQEMALVPQSFPPPFHLLSGFDLSNAGKLVQGVGVKFYTMHWPMIMADFAGAMAGNKAYSGEIAKALVTTFGTGEEPPKNTAEFHYPEPDEAHSASSMAIEQKIAAARAEAGDLPVYAFTHAYGPLGDVMRRAISCWQASGGEMWVNRYGYMSDEKIAAFGDLVKPTA